MRERQNKEQHMEENIDYADTLFIYNSIYINIPKFLPININNRSTHTIAADMVPGASPRIGPTPQRIGWRRCRGQTLAMTWPVGWQRDPGFCF